MHDSIQTMLMLLGVLGFLSLGLSGFLVVNTISALLAQQVRQIGIMKAIGGRRGQIAGMYLGMVLVFGFLSLFIAVPLGALGAWLFSSFMGPILAVQRRIPGAGAPDGAKLTQTSGQRPPPDV